MPRLRVTPASEYARVRLTLFVLLVVAVAMAASGAWTAPSVAATPGQEPPTSGPTIPPLSSTTTTPTTAAPTTAPPTTSATTTSTEAPATTEAPDVTEAPEDTEPSSTVPRTLPPSTAPPTAPVRGPTTTVAVDGVTRITQDTPALGGVLTVWVVAILASVTMLGITWHRNGQDPRP